MGKLPLAPAAAMSVEVVAPLRMPNPQDSHGANDARADLAESTVSAEFRAAVQNQLDKVKPPDSPNRLRTLITN